MWTRRLQNAGSGASKTAVCLPHKTWTAWRWWCNERRKHTHIGHRCRDEAEEARREADAARRDAAAATAAAENAGDELRDALRSAEAQAAAPTSAAHANGDASMPQHPIANGHVSGGIEDAAEAAAVDALRLENEELKEKLQGVEKRIAGAAAVQARPLH